MQPRRLVVLFLCAWAGHAVADDHPVGKVITLLQDLMAKSKAEGQAEEVSYQKFVYWCKTSAAELSDAIKEEKDTIDTLESTIDGKTKEVVLLNEEIHKLETEITKLDAAGTEASEDDQERNALYLKKEADLKSTIDSIGEAITALKEAETTTDSAMLLSKHRLAKQHVRDVFALIATVASDGEQHSLMNFVNAKDGEEPAADAPAGDDKPAVAAAGDMEKHVDKYNFKSNSVTELLKGLKLKFEDELTEATKEETNAANAYSLSKQARDAAIAAAKSAKEQKENDLADTNGALEAAQKSLKSEKGDLEADSATLGTTKDGCNMKKSEWEERSSIREREMKACEAAIAILAKVTGVKTEAPANPVPPPSPVQDGPPEFLQILTGNDPQAKAVQLLRSTAKTYRLKALERLAQEVSTHAPKQFQDVINQIQKMIFRLKAEQTDEDNHKAWCDLELEKTSTSLSDKNDKIAELKAKIDEHNANVVSLTADIEAAQEMIADIKKFQAEATDIRKVGKQENAAAIKDAVDAQKAITNAISVLTTFYKSSGAIAKEPWEFLQQPVELGENPATWESSFTGTEGGAGEGGVISVLETTSSDFAQMEANTRAQEVADQNAYDEEMKKNSIELARRQKESDMKGEEKKRLLSKITDLTSQKKHVSDEVEATETYEKDLQKACVDGDSTYEDRKAARTAEIEALKEAQVILDKAFDATTEAPSAFLMKIRKH